MTLAVAGNISPFDAVLALCTGLDDDEYYSRLNTDKEGLAQDIEANWGKIVREAKMYGAWGGLQDEEEGGR